jgi:hypothetical protein
LLDLAEADPGTLMLDDGVEDSSFDSLIRVWILFNIISEKRLLKCFLIDNLRARGCFLAASFSLFSCSFLI